MTKASYIAVLATVAAVAMVLAGASSAAQPRPGHSPGVAAWTIKQVGKRNYAGPKCPGRGWNCTTSTRVLQVATGGGQNVAQCLGPGGSVVFVDQSCTITQTGASNTARCTERSTDASASQSCEITQSGAENYAFVDQSVSQADGPTQVGYQTAVVTQTASVTNQLQLRQDADQSTKASDPQMQDAYQSASVSQTATGAGTNFSSLYQSQLQKAYARGTTQSQDAGGGTPLPDCVAGPPSAPNACADVQQHSDAGTNENHLRQSINEDMNSSGAATQVQGSLNGGLDGHVHQDTVSGSSLNDANQSKNQKETAATGSSQTQHDPISCCGIVSQFGGSGNMESITQSSALSASEAFAFQTSQLIGTSKTPDGTCTVKQSASINTDSTNNSATLTPCPLLTLITSCSSGSTEGGGGSCFAAPPDVGAPDSSLTLGVRNCVPPAGSPLCDPTGATYSSTAGALSGNTLEYKVVYTNAGTAPAHNVSVSVPVPAGTTAVNLTCPQSATPVFTGGVLTSWTCVLGPTADPGTVAPDTFEVFRTVTFTVTINATTACTLIPETVSVQTAEEGTVASNPTTVTVNPSACIG